MAREENNEQLIGRAEEIERCQTIVQPGTLTTVLGPAGVGKTTLVDAYAESSAQRMRAYVHLADAVDHASVVQNVAQALGVAGRAARVDLTQQIARTLESMNTGVVILDNAEHVLEILTEVLEIWRASAPSIGWLITSQARLHASGEQLIDLSPLSLPDGESVESIRASDAVQLLLARIQAVRTLPDPMSHETLLTLSRIARALDGLPLALELAASRMRILSPGEVLEHLEQRFRVLRSSMKSRVDGRHATLENALEWSWSQLPDWAQTAAAQMSVFVGGFEYRAAEHILDLSAYAEVPDILDVLETLLDHSILQRREVDGATRFSQLASIREFAHSKLTEGGGLGVSHAQYFGAESLNAARATHNRAGPKRQWLVRNQFNIQQVVDDLAEHGQCASALSALLALEELLYTTPLHVHLKRFETVLAHPDAETERALWIAVKIAQARSFRFLGHAPASIAALDAVLVVIEGSDFRAEQVRARIEKARALRAIGRADDAKTMLLDAMAQADAWSLPDWVHAAMGTLALADFAAGRLSAAMTQLKAVNEAYAQRGIDQLERVSQVNLGRCHVELGELDEAERCFSRSVELGALIHHEWSMGYGHTKLGEVKTVHGQTDQAQVEFSTALDMLRRAGDKPHEAEALRARGDCEVISGELTSALNTYDQALAIAAEHGVRRVEVEARLGAAFVYCLQETGRMARQRAEEALSIAQGFSDPTMVVGARCILALACGVDGDAEGAQSLVSEAKTQVNDALPRAQAILELTGIYLLAVDGQHRQAALALGGSGAVDSTVGARSRWFETQMIETLIHRRLPVELAGEVAGADGDLLVAAHGFQVKDADPVDLSRKDLLCRFLHVLVDAHLQTPGEPVALDRVIEQLWPDERMVRDAGATRVYAAVANLRRMGLKPLLLRRGGGYLIDPDAKVVRRR